MENKRKVFEENPIKERQHYVFQSYLKKWNDKDKQLWFSQNGKIKCKGSKAVAYEPFFYRTRTLNDDELKFLKLIIKYDTSPIAVKKAIDLHIELYQTPLKNREAVYYLKQLLVTQFGAEEKIPIEILSQVEKIKKFVDAEVINFEENFYSEIESDLARYFEDIINGNTDFYENEESRKSFFDAVLMQYFRTKAIRERWKVECSELLDSNEVLTHYGLLKENIDLDNVLPYYFWVVQNLCSYHLSKNKSSLTTYENTTSVHFITSDQPVINIDADYTTNTMPEKFRLYYPISPVKAIMISGEVMDVGGSVMLSNIKEIDEKNIAIVKASKEYFFADSKENVERYKVVSV